jgi:acetate kinase
MICSDMEFLGMDFDAEVNDKLKSEDKIISKEGSRVTIMTVITDEELVIASDTNKIVGAIN